MAIEFKEWGKIPRLNNEKQFITEKIDGTNACIVIDEEGNFGCQSRTRLITPEDDNFGFARWAYENKDELMKLGAGHHFGEWWGAGIQRNYGISDKRFSLFNTHRWLKPDAVLPNCVHVVPTIDGTINEAIELLKTNGSLAAPGFMRVEGIIVYNSLTKSYYKVILDK